MKVLQPTDKATRLNAEHYTEAKTVATARKKPKQPSGIMTDNMTENEEMAFIHGIVDDMTEAAQDAIRENDRLGIPSVSASKGKLVVRKPAKKVPQP